MFYFSISNYTMTSSIVYWKTSKRNYIYQCKFCPKKKKFSSCHLVRQNEYRLSHRKLRCWETLLWPQGIRPLSERKIICTFSNLNFVLSWASQYVPDKLSVLYWSLRTEEVRGEPFLGCLFVFVTLSSFTIIKCQQNSSCLLLTATHRYFLDCRCVL